MEGGRPLRYLVVGVINTIFGYLFAVVLYYLLPRSVSVFAIGLVASVLNITFSFVTYKLLVFRTQGRWVQEYLRSFAVYGVAGVAASGGLWLLVEKLGMFIWWAQAIVLAGVVCLSYIGHSRFTFRRATTPVIGREK